MKVEEGKVEELKKEINNLAKGENKAIVDGIIDIDKYNNAKYKILWVLKEPYGKDEKSIKGGWALNETLCKKLDKLIQNNKEEKGIFNLKVYRNMLAVNHSILSNTDYEKNHTQEHYINFKKTAFINVKKFSGKTSSYMPTIRKAYKKEKELLHNQIKIYNPDIIIFGNTFSLFKKELLKQDTKWEKKALNFKKRSYYIQNGILYIDTYHPSLRRAKIKDYTNSILKAVNDWENSFKTV